MHTTNDKQQRFRFNGFNKSLGSNSEYIGFNDLWAKKIMNSTRDIDFGLNRHLDSTREFKIRCIQFVHKFDFNDRFKWILSIWKSNRTNK